MENEIEKPDHDGLFKELLTSHLEEFLEGFFPEVHKELDFTNFGLENFLSQEQVAEIGGKLHRLDVVAKVNIKNDSTGKAYLVVFVEAQRTRRKEFLARMFRYFALLYLKFNTMIIPIVIYSDDAKWKDENEWTTYQMEFAGHKFLDFKFLAVKPSMLSIREYLRSTNPAQLALAALMNLDGTDLVRSKMLILKRLYSLRMTESDMMKAASFVDNYMEDENLVQKELDLSKEEEFKEAGMLLSHVRNEGIALGEKKKAFESAGKLAKSDVSWKIIENCTGISKPEYEQWLASK